LAQPAAQLPRIRIQPLLRRRDTNVFELLGCDFARLALVDIPVQPDGLDDLSPTV